MDDFLKVRFALDNVHPPEVAKAAVQAFDRILGGKAVSDTGSPDWERYAELGPCRCIRAPSWLADERRPRTPSRRDE